MIYRYPKYIRDAAGATALIADERGRSRPIR